MQASDHDEPSRLPTSTDAPRIDALALETCLKVLADAGELPADHPDSLTVQRAVGRLFKEVKRQRRSAARRKRQAADRAVIAHTATGSPQRIDDETAGIPLVSTAPGAIAGYLQRAQDCYICKTPYTQVDAFYHQLCPDCAADNRARRDPVLDLRGKRALLTGGRAKIGMYIALMLLRAGCALTITTRFPRDAARRFASQDDFATWGDRLTIIGVDLRDPAQVAALADEVAAAGALDILINNAAQTVRRSPGAYADLAAAETVPVHGAAAAITTVLLGRSADEHPASLLTATANVDTLDATAAELARTSLRAGQASLKRYVTGDVIDAGGLRADIVDTNSWVHTVDHVSPLEMLEVQLCNAVAPFILISRLRPALEASPARRKYIVNVSAMEGVFSRRYKGAGHPHTNMAKAGLNMLTRTSAAELFTHRILMTAVDTGWITDERPHTTKVRLAAEGFHAPLDLVDGAARVVDPIVRGEAGEDLYGVFLKDFAVYPW